VSDTGRTGDNLFGIVVPFYSRHGYFLELIESLLKQSDGRFEVLIIDDSGKNLIGKDFLTKSCDDRFSLIANSSNFGPFVSWNIGLSEMFSRQRYRILSIVHEDDLLNRDYVKNSLEAVEKHPSIDVFHSRVKIIGSYGKPKITVQDLIKGLANLGSKQLEIQSAHDSGLARILSNNFVFCPTMVFNASKFESIEFGSRWKMVGDLDFIANALLSGRTFLQLPDKNYFYRRHENNLTVKLTSTTTRFQEELQIYNELEEVCKTAGFNASAKVAGNARIIKLHIAYRIVISLVRFDLSGLRQLISVYPFKKN